jgi:hypothetical protein
MRSIYCGILVAILAACGSSTDTSPVRYNFGIIDGRNQLSTAGAATLARPITSQLTRDPQGKFATRVFDFLVPEKAYAQGLSLAGDPVANQIVCAREAGPGEPQAVPLCAFTLADGTAPIEIKGGTKAGVFVVTFTAQVQSQEPVRDSTTVTVQAGPMVTNAFSHGTTYSCFVSPAVFPSDALRDQYGNDVHYRLVPSDFAHAASDTLGTVGARTLVADKDGIGTVSVFTEFDLVATGKLEVAGSCVSLTF